MELKIKDEANKVFISAFPDACEYEEAYSPLFPLCAQCNLQFTWIYTLTGIKSICDPLHLMTVQMNCKLHSFTLD